MFVIDASMQRGYPAGGGKDMAHVLETELKTYEKHRDELLATHEGEFVLIHGEQIYDTFESQRDAINTGYRQYGNVPFLVKKIERFETPVTFGGGMLGIRV
jgi:hypothetical protein